MDAACPLGTAARTQAVTPSPYDGVSPPNPMRTLAWDQESRGPAAKKGACSPEKRVRPLGLFPTGPALHMGWTAICCVVGTRRDRCFEAVVGGCFSLWSRFCGIPPMPRPSGLPPGDWDAARSLL